MTGAATRRKSPDRETTDFMKAEPSPHSSGTARYIRLTADVVLVVAVCALFIVQLKWMLCYQLGYDDAFFAVYAKNIAAGHGFTSLYGSTAPDGVYRATYPFPHDVGTGLGLLLPAAFVIKIFGNKPWVPGLALIALSMGGLASGFLLLRTARSYRQYISLVYAVGLVLSVAFLFMSPGGYYVVLFQLYGEWYASVLVVSGTVFLFHSLDSRWSSKGAGVVACVGSFLLAVAVNTKYPVILMVAVIVALFWLVVLCAPAEPGRKRMVLVTAPLIIPLSLLSVSVARYLAIGDYQRWLALNKVSTYFVEHGGSGIAGFKSAPNKVAYIRSLLAINGELFSRWAGGHIAALLLLSLMLSAVCFSVYSFSRVVFWKDSKFRRFVLPAGLILGGFPLYAWWFAFQDYRLPRHLEPAILPVTIGIVLACTIMPMPIRARIWLSIILAIPYLVCLGAAVPTLRFIATDASGPWKAGVGLIAQRETASYLEALRGRQPGAVFLGCGAESVPEIDFLMKGVGNIHDCLGWTNQDPQHAVVYLVRSTDWAQYPELYPVELRCSETIYDRPLPPPFEYTVSRCPPISRLDRAVPVMQVKSVELLTNPGFDQLNESGMPRQWDVFGSPRVVKNSQQAYSAPFFVQVTQHDILYQRVPAATGTIFTLALKARAVQPRQIVWLEVQWLDENRKSVGDAVKPYAVGGDWKEYRASFEGAPERTAYVQVCARAAPGSTVYVDDVSLVEGRVRTLSESDVAVNTSKYARDPSLLRRRAEEFWQKHQYADAVRFLEPIVDGNPESAEGQYSLAFSDSLSGNNQEAVKHYTRALDLGYSEFWVKYNRGAAYLALGKKAEARADILRAKELDPTNAGVKVYLKLVK